MSSEQRRRRLAEEIVTTLRQQPDLTDRDAVAALAVVLAVLIARQPDTDQWLQAVYRRISASVRERRELDRDRLH